MATTYKLIDATLAGDTYTVTVDVNRNATGAQRFVMNVEKPTSVGIDPEFVAKVASWALASGTPLNTLKNITYTIP